MQYKVSNQPPKFAWFIKLFFPDYNFDYIVMAFGDTIYAKNPLSDETRIHEEVHLKQHHYSKAYACFYLVKYIMSARFRLDMELEAYQKEYAYVCTIMQDLPMRKMYLASLANDLSSPLYGSLITKDEAEDLIAQRNEKSY